VADTTSVKIYSVLHALQPGTVGPKSRIKAKRPCPVCSLSDRKRFEHLDLMLDAWEPCEFVGVQSNETFAVSPRLRDELLEAGARGAVFRDMNVTRGGNFDVSSPGVALPALVQLDVESVISAATTWYDPQDKCERCGRIVYQPNANKRAAGATTSSRRPKGPPRRVAIGAWNGDDLFWTLDPGPPIVTEKVKLLLDQSIVPQLILHPAEFV
jgi:hypothetical protein